MSVPEGRSVDWFVQVGVAGDLIQTITDSVAPMHLCWGSWHAPPDRLMGNCALYLTLRTLRI